MSMKNPLPIGWREHFGLSDWFRVLGLPRDASPEAVHERALDHAVKILKEHPGAELQIAELEFARDVLADAEGRAAYIAALEEARIGTLIICTAVVGAFLFGWWRWNSFPAGMAPAHPPKLVVPSNDAAYRAISVMQGHEAAFTTPLATAEQMDAAANALAPLMKESSAVQQCNEVAYSAWRFVSEKRRYFRPYLESSPVGPRSYNETKVKLQVELIRCEATADVKSSLLGFIQ